MVEPGSPAPAPPTVRLTVLGLSGEAVLDAQGRALQGMAVEPNETVKQLKSRISSKDPALLALMYNGRELKDGATCSSLGWQDEVTIYRVLRRCDFEAQIAPRRRITSKEENFTSPSLVELKRLCAIATEEFSKEPSMLELEAPLTIAAYLTGRMDQLNQVFTATGDPDCSAVPPYLFLGNYVNRGHQGTDVIITLLAYKCQYPDKIFLLRGRHDCRHVSRMSEFYDEVTSLYNRTLWKLFVDVFDHLPLCARVNNRIFCVSGGISPELQYLDQIRELKRPWEVQDKGLICDLLWSDPTEDHDGWSDSDRGLSHTFGQDVFQEFCERNGIDLLVRGMQLSEGGYEYFFQQRLVNIFTCAEYMNEYRNRAAVMLLDKDLQHQFVVF